MKLLRHIRSSTASHRSQEAEPGIALSENIKKNNAEGSEFPEFRW
jgi:hypothetical protein